MSKDTQNYPNLSIAVAGRFRMPSIAQPIEIGTPQKEDNGDGSFTYSYPKDEDRGLTAEVQVKTFKNCTAKRQTVTVKNTSQKTVTLEELASGTVKLSDGKLPWYDPQKYRISYCQSAWQGEGQWRSATPDELGLVNIYCLRSLRAVNFSSKGSWSTSVYFPMIYIEDLECRKTWFFEVESSAAWCMELGIYSDDGNEGLYVSMDAANVLNDGWRIKLQSGESYTTVPCVYGCADGDINDAVREVTKLHRLCSVTPAARPMPLVFNDYMGALWAMPSDKNLPPLIEKAAEAGAEYFCIDAGWYQAPDQKTDHEKGLGLGRFSPYEERFGDIGFQGILDLIKSHGMKPGIWLEIEAFETFVKNELLDEDCFLKRDGEIIEPPRGFLDLRNKKAHDYILSVFNDLYDRGVRFIKNDYNHTVGIGCDSETGSFSEGLQEHAKALYALFDEVHKLHPDMLIENCGSGAQRADGGIMRHSDLLSTSDQMVYYANPSIAAGTLAYTLPEKAGIWSFPYHLPYQHKQDEYSDFFNEEYIKAHKDGEETIFNMVTAAMGVMYLSGHPDFCDEENLALYNEGAALYKELRDFTCKAYPVYPGGFFRMCDRGFFSLGLINEEKTRMILSVWRIGGEEKDGAVDLSKWVKDTSEAVMIYPEKGYEVPFCLSDKTGVLTLTLEKEMSARLFEIKL